MVRNTNKHALWQTEIVTNLPQQAYWRRILFSSLGSDSSVVEPKRRDNGIIFQVWLSGMQKRAMCTTEQVSTKHLFQTSCAVMNWPISGDRCLDQVPHPA
jgi:hypothetical protein